MKKLLISIAGLALLAGCSSYYDYYKGGVRYTQDGDDCIYRAVERGRHFNDEIRTMDSDKKVVYRNTSCRDMYARDAFGLPKMERQVVAPAAQEVKSCGCDKCGATKRKYVIVPAK